MKEYLHIYLKYLTNMVEDSFLNHFSGEISSIKIIIIITLLQ